jgi:isoleucyl-tRNA synthetase
MFKEVNDLDFPELERRTLQFWEEHRVFDALREQNCGGPRYSFMDGPITANNARGIGVHHAWGRTYKDIFQRYKSMRGFDQRYQNGFDCQGLWVEVEIEKELGFKSKGEIDAYGLDRFARQCRQRVDTAADAIVTTSRRLGQWMDWSDSYYTYTDANIEHIWHFLKKCRERGWLYKGHRVMPWCARCGTSLSQHELADAYAEVTHRAVYLELPLRERTDERVLVWTTTPWTLPANVALAVHPELEYVGVRQNDRVLYLSRSVKEHLLPDAPVLHAIRGADLVGLAYTGPFDHLPVQRDVVHRILPWDQVGEGEGSGVVHIAPGCGAEDYELGKEHDLPILAPLDEIGFYLDGYGPFTGKRFSEAADGVFAHLRENDHLHRVEEYPHRYPHCWRCSDELAFRLADEWFIACDELRPRMLAATRQVRWVPEHAGKRMEDWLRNMGDWCISRKRFWGLPLPFYESDDGELVVVGSREELRTMATDPRQVDRLPELHRPWIDDVEIRTPSGQKARRVAEVGDCWLDAGIVPFSTLGYLDGNRRRWNEWFPADFVVEMREQTRLWFYAQLFMSVALEDRPPYRMVMTYEKMHDEKGDPMHKSAGNAVWFDEAVEVMGAEPMRWLFAGQSLSLNIPFGYGPAAEVKRRLLTLWNSYRFYVQYAELDQLDPNLLEKNAEFTDMDRWLMSRLQLLIRTLEAKLEEYDLPPVVRAVEEFLDDLSNWYVRLNRRRFWKSSDDADKAAAHLTLHRALVTLSRLLAPFLPFLAEELYQNLVRAVDRNAPKSVHLCSYPVVQEEWIDAQLMTDVEQLKQVVSLGRSVRTARGLKVRQPLRRLLVAGDPESHRALERLGDLALRELNVKSLVFLDDDSELIDCALKPNFRLLGRRYGRLLPQIQQALAGVNPTAAVARLESGSALTLSVEGENLVLDRDEVEVVTRTRGGLGLETEGNLTVALDLELDDDLLAEGWAREFVRHVQQLRKKRGLDVTDRITVIYCAPVSISRALDRHATYIQAETLCLELEVDERLQGERCTIDGNPVFVDLRRVA